MDQPMSHDEAIDTVVGCAMTTTLLSYQEAIETYLDLRGLRRLIRRDRDAAKTGEKGAVCIISNCRRRAPAAEPFCSKHRDKGTA